MVDDTLLGGIVYPEVSGFFGKPREFLNKDELKDLQLLVCEHSNDVEAAQTAMYAMGLLDDPYVKEQEDESMDEIEST